MFNKKQTKKTSVSKLNYAFLVAAIASVLVLGTGYSQMQSFGQGFDDLPGFDIASDLKQTADCAGMLNDCGNDNSRDNPPTETPGVDPPVDADCTLGIACVVDRLNPTQLGNLKFTLGLPSDASNQLLCDELKLVSEVTLRAAITAPVVGVTDAVATSIINCLINAGFSNLA